MCKPLNFGMQLQFGTMDYWDSKLDLKPITNSYQKDIQKKQSNSILDSQSHGKTEYDSQISKLKANLCTSNKYVWTVVTRMLQIRHSNFSHVNTFRT